MEFLLNQLSKEQLIELLQKSEARAERAIQKFKNFYDRARDNENQENYTLLWRNKSDKQLDSAMELLKEIALALNTDSDKVSDGECLDMISQAFEDANIYDISAEGKYAVEFYSENFTSLCEKDFQEWEAKRGDRKASQEAIKQRFINEINTGKHE